MASNQYALGPPLTHNMSMDNRPSRGTMYDDMDALKPSNLDDDANTNTTNHSALTL